MMRKIILLCSGGMSSSLLASKMSKYAKSVAYEIKVEAYGVGEAIRVAHDADLVLIGPQVRFNLDLVKKQLPNIPVEVINMRDYGRMDGEEVIKRIQYVLGD